ncbi:tetratricopeptide repeat protein [Thermobifida fusca]|nr:tetratricopeptide repeat protein [Thermobifida fusca]
MSDTGSTPNPTPAHIKIIKAQAGNNVIGQQITKENNFHFYLHRSRPTAKFSLPAPPPALVGRQHEVDTLLSWLDPTASHQEEDETSSSVVVSALAGMGGVGKTALVASAGRIAHQREWFCAELFVDLRGYTPGAVPLSAGAALDVLLRQMGIAPEEIPAELEERAAFYRSALTELSRNDPRGRPVLVVVDNAQSAEQVRPLLPGPGNHRLVATSRSSLHSLTGAHHIDLDVLTADAAVELVASILKEDDARTRDTEGLRQLAEVCGYLPLALEIVAAQLARTPQLTPARLVQRLKKAASRVDKIHDLSRDASQTRILRAVFDTSLAQLTDDEARVFLLTASSPGPTISTSAAAVLTGLDEDAVEEVLEELVAVHLLQHASEDRWGAHDLLIDYAASHPQPPADRDQALTRLLDYYVTTAHAADTHLKAPPSQEVSNRFARREEALAWLDNEQATLVAAALAAPTLDHTDAAVLLPLLLTKYLDLRRRFGELEQVSRSAQAVAHATDNPNAEAQAWLALGLALVGMRRPEEGGAAFTRARDLFRQTGNTLGEVEALTGLGGARQQARQLDDALEAFTNASNLLGRITDPRSGVPALTGVGLALQSMGRFKEALDALDRAHALLEQTADPYGEAQVLSCRGLTLLGMSRFEHAIKSLTRAQELFQRTGDAHAEAQTWVLLGTALNQANRPKEAIDAFTHARELFQRTEDTQGEAQAWAGLAEALRKTGQTEEAVKAADHVRDLLGQEEGAALGAPELAALGMSQLASGEFTEAVDTLTRARTLFRQTTDARGEAEACAGLGTALIGAGRGEAAAEAFTRAQELFQQAGDIQSEAQAWSGLAAALGQANRPEEALKAVTRAQELFQQIGDTKGEAEAWAGMGLTLLGSGRIIKALKAFVRARQLRRQSQK